MADELKPCPWETKKSGPHELRTWNAGRTPDKPPTLVECIHATCTIAFKPVNLAKWQKRGEPATYMKSLFEKYVVEEETLNKEAVVAERDAYRKLLEEVIYMVKDHREYRVRVKAELEKWKCQD